MEFLQMCHCKCSGVGTLFEVDDMLCHIVEPNKVMMIDVALCRRRECKVEGGLACWVTVHSIWITLCFRMTYALHLAELIPNNFDNIQGLQP